MQTYGTPIALTLFNGENRLDSRLIASELDIKHKALYLMLKRYRADFYRFGMIWWDIGDIKGRSGPEKFALLNQAQVERLLTYADDRPDTYAAGHRLLQAFGVATCLPAAPKPAGLIPFSFESREIRAFNIDGNPWFVGKDVCEALGYVNHNDAITRHCKGVAKHYPLQTAGGSQEVRIINEPNIYRLITGSTLPAAERFEKWVFEEVLPSIRKTGSYSLPGAAQPVFERPISAVLKTTINRQAWRLAQETFETYRVAMLNAARANPAAFKPEQWNPDGLPLPQPATLEQSDMADVARQLALKSPYRTRNPYRDYEVLRLRLEGLEYRKIGLEVGISEAHAWRIVNRQLGKAGAL